MRHISLLSDTIVQMKLLRVPWTGAMERIVRKSQDTDIDCIVSLVASGRQKMRDSGNLNQWTKGDPQPKLLKRDIQAGTSYIIEENNIPIATFAFVPGPDETYAKIYEGKWLDDEPYYVVHRIASAPNTHGVFNTLLDYCLKHSNNIRIDTHRDNVIMRSILPKVGFIYCGIIYLNDGAERLAFQLKR